jgi:hypothetical protein
LVAFLAFGSDEDRNTRRSLDDFLFHSDVADFAAAAGTGILR